ncbi:hypothetical protein ABE29_22995 [Cytobacillus firmus]|uniref:hypothetical protein n=1 Tax=Cytobacillus firmus TaxID=1399 RepID=UPI00077CB8BE|nr:hypothetical protein [Cytobacillus firmus]MBG9545511.1 hypothetical protein [Cytobacillus firmus]MBG9551174.1 hypothetical protein [Cytobacillus firmus]MBG9557956.1 hypothetical protein [Cytobacillus firmus]MBG9577580.1 hypothetical protein [Cytobacillus firmus]MEC1891658.1 hypothetical protein [Cytobacillus firmus]
MNHGSYYGTRRKRNIDLSRFRNEESSSGLHWESNEEQEEEMEYGEELEEGEEEVEVDESESSDKWDSHFDNDQADQEQLYLNGKPFHVKQQPKKQSFNETHVRITTYLEKNVHQIIRMLQKQGQIESITKFINDSVTEYLMNQYQERNQ